MNPIETFLRQHFGVPSVDRDETNLILARKWREEIEERVQTLEDQVRVLIREAVPDQ